MTIQEIAKIFREEVQRIWGDRVNNYLEIDYVIEDKQKPHMCIRGFIQRPKAIDNHMILMNKKHTLGIAPQALDLSHERLLAIIRHEVIHLGYQLHDRKFFDMCKKYDAQLTGESYKSGNPLMYQAQIKKGSRYETIKRFNDEQEAYRWLKGYCYENRCNGRIKL